MIQSLQAGRILDLPSEPTLSDATSGSLEADSVTFDYCRRYVNRTISVRETEIAGCLRQFIDTHNMLIEGSAAVAIAAMEQMADELAGKNLIVILCGANIGSKKLLDVLS